MTVYAVIGVLVGLALIVGLIILGARRRVSEEMQLPAPEAERASGEVLDPSQFVAADPLERLVEAIACWDVRLGDSRVYLVEAAVGLVVAGDDRQTVVELASLYPNADSFEIDSLLERLVIELDLKHALAAVPGALVTRRICRAVLYENVNPRELARWAHAYFHHESDSDLVNELAAIDDDYDGADEGWGQASPVALDARVREIASLLLGAA